MIKEEYRESKAYLGRVYSLSREIEQLKEEIQQMEEMVVSIQAINYSERVQTSFSKDLADIIQKIEDYKASLEEKVSEYISLVAEVTSKIREIDDMVIREVLARRYVLFLKFKAIADDLGYSIQHVYRLHTVGLKEILKIVKDESK